MTTPIRRLLIANRGEIVCRIVATCRLMGIETVTVFAGDDSALPHARAGDFGCLLEGNTLADTYLNAAQLVALARKTKCDALHPGYGFLSENAAFAREVAAAGLVFVGPPASVIARMGDKAASRQLCEAIGVPVIPGYDGEKQDAAVFAREAQRIGFPVLVKASAGGGGKGMRIVSDAKSLAAAVESARAEAVNAFGNGRLLLEKYLLQPRHIEVQVFSDAHGNHRHLFERECSIQRRHQKIIEESPAPNLPEVTRRALFAAALKITAHIGYVGAGTVEFILDNTGRFYFLEMNTRLQVEHPVTELTTGLDLVRMQLEVAMGAPLALSQDEIAQRGHAVEARLYAEDAARDFMPAAGRLSVFELPHLPGLRCENGYESGCDVSPRYDPMLAKLAAFGRTRAEAIALLLQGLEESRVVGVTTNRAFLMRVLEAAPFREGNIATDFIARYGELLAPPALSDAALARVVAAYMLFGAEARIDIVSDAEHSAWTHPQLAGWR